MKKILIVDDDAVIRKMYTDLLEKSGFGVFVAADYYQAVEVIGKEQIDLVLLDLMLAGDRNGFDFLEAIKKDPERKNIKVIVLTNLDTEEKVSKEIGAEDYLVKVNTKPNQVLEKIKEML